MIEPTQRVCSQCGQVRPLGWFVKNGSGRLRSACRECLRAKRARDRAARRMRIAGGRAGRITAADLQALGARQGWRCACGCGRVVRWEYHVDHVRALARGGAHRVENLALLAPICNLRKGAR